MGFGARGGNPIQGLYPQPPQPGGGSALAGNPMGVIGLAIQLQQNQRAQQLFNAQRAVGQAVQGGIDPVTGDYDPTRTISGIASNPAAALGAGAGVSDALTAKNQNTAIATNVLNLGVKNNEAAAAIVGSYASLGRPLTDTDVATIKAKLAAVGVVPRVVGAADIGSVVKTAEAAKVGATQTMGPAAAATPVPVAPGVSGAPAVAPLGSTLGVTGRPVGLPPGQAEAAGGIAAASAGQANTLTQSADSSPIRKGMLGNLEGDIDNFTAGPGADWTKVAKAWANRNILPSGMQFDPQSIASQEAFTKQAEQLAQQQFQAIGGTGTDAKFGSAFKSNPNETLSAMGNKGIINLLKGNEDAIQAKNGAWQKWLAAGNPPQSYPQFAAQFNQTFDPRLFQSQYMNKDDFVKMTKGMSPAELRDFSTKLKASQGMGMVVGPGAYYGGQ